MQRCGDKAFPKTHEHVCVLFTLLSFVGDPCVIHTVSPTKNVLRGLEHSSFEGPWLRTSEMQRTLQLLRKEASVFSPKHFFKHSFPPLHWGLGMFWKFGRP